MPIRRKHLLRVFCTLPGFSKQNHGCGIWDRKKCTGALQKHRCIFHGKQTRLPVQRKGQAQQEKDRNDQHRIADLARQNRVRQRTDVLAYPVENLTAQVRGKDADDGHAKRLMLQRYSDILNTRDDLTDDQYDEMIGWFASVEDWTGEIKDMLDASFG